MSRSVSNRIRSGISQLTIVEHALCPLDARVSVTPNLIHEATFRYNDRQSKRQTATARVLCPLGLSPKDEIILWGLLSLTLADPDSEGQLYATRHFILRRLGLVDAKRRRGGRQYSDFSDTVERLSAVRYQCDAFYDPIRAEHRKVGFGFFSYSIPLDEESNRAWRFAWDPVFFELVQAAGGYLRFDLETYRSLDAAGRRMLLFLSKLCYRKSMTPRLNIIELAEQVFGMAKSASTRDKKDRVMRCVRQLKQRNIVSDYSVSRIAKGKFQLVLHKGSAIGAKVQPSPVESPLFEPLIDIGFDAAGANRLLRRYKGRIVREWVDITLAAKERFSDSFFRSSAPAFLTDNVKHASNGTRTPPDWWQDIRKAEQRLAAERAKSFGRKTSSDSVESQAIGTVDQIHDSIFNQFIAAGQSEEVARENAQHYESALKRKTGAG